MKIEPIAYLEWAKFPGKIRINLSRSGLPDLSLSELPVKLETKDLDISGANPYGYQPLIEAIANRYSVSPEEVIPTQGASQAIFMTCAVILNQGDTVAVEKPAYEPLLRCPQLLGAGVVRLERRLENGYRIDLDDYRKVLNEGAKLVILTNLHNPTGVWLTKEEVNLLAREAEKVGAYLFLDEIYLEFLSGAAGQSAFGLNDRVIVASSLTKVYGLGGLRCGWVLAPKKIAGSFRRLMDYLIVEGVFIGEKIASLVFPYLDEIRAKSLPVIERNRQLLIEFISSEEKLRWVAPAGGVVCFPRLVAGGNGDEFSFQLLSEAGIRVVPGSFFEAPAHFRLGYSVPTETLRQALEAMHSLLTRW